MFFLQYVSCASGYCVRGAHTACTAFENGPFGGVTCPVLQCKTGRFVTRCRPGCCWASLMSGYCFTRCVCRQCCMLPAEPCCTVARSASDVGHDASICLPCWRYANALCQCLPVIGQCYALAGKFCQPAGMASRHWWAAILHAAAGKTKSPATSVGASLRGLCIIARHRFRFRASCVCL